MRKLGHDAAPSSNGAGPDVRPEDCGIPQIILREGTTDMHGGDHNEDASVPPPAVTAPIAQSGPKSEEPPISKNQQKKLRKKQEWESKREERKVIRKEKIVAKRERKREQHRREVIETGQETPLPTMKVLSQKAVTLPITIMIDCDFDNLMRDHERISLASQITRSYSDNKNSDYRAHLAICSFNGKLRERFDSILSHYKGWRGVRWLDESFCEATKRAKQWMIDGQNGGHLDGVFAKYADLDDAAKDKLKDEGEVVYLSSEGDEDLTELKPYSTYIIGGLVDKNREKGLCYKRATSKGIRTARLPIGEFLEMASRKVLATNHVNEIMVKWLECGDWGEAFLKAIPKRKGGVLKGGGKGSPGSPGSEDEDMTATYEQELSTEELNEAQAVDKESPQTIGHGDAAPRLTPV